MKILHCCLSCFYNENYNYQENLLPRQHKQDGHEVLIVASTEVFQGNRAMGYVEPETYVNGDGIKVIRVPYKKIVNDAISRKFRAYQGVYPIIEEFEPDVILFHGMSAWEILTVVRYVKKHKVKLYIDNHASLNNSGTNWISLHILHGLFYKNILKKALPYTEKILNIAMEEDDFARDVYKVPDNKLELYPLGGYLQSDEEYEQRRNKSRKELQVDDDTIVFMHSGKMDKYKKTCELIRAFSKVKDERFRLFIAGEFLDDIEDEAKELVAADPRVQYLGWKNGEELLELLIGADVYLQPGTRSATMQNAMCCRCAMMVYPFRTYKAYLNDDGYYVETEEDIENVFSDLSKHTEKIALLKEKTFKRAQEILDYKVLAARIYEGIEEKKETEK